VDVEKLRQQGMIQCDGKHYAKAEACFRSCIAHGLNEAIDYYNLGFVLARQYKYKEAIPYFIEALRRNPGLVPGYNNLGYCLLELGFIDGAFQAFTTAHQINPEDSIALLNQGLALLTLGRLSEGWPLFEARWQRTEARLFHRSFTQPLWRGDALRGKTILLHAEEGFGDSIQMVRYAPLLEATGAKVIIEVQAPLKKLFQSLPSTIVIHERGKTLPIFDYHVPMLSLPLGFHTTLETIPAKVPYLTASLDDLKSWETTMASWGPQKIKRIGLAWAGRFSHERDTTRTIDLVQLKPLLDHPFIQWVNLQHPLSASHQDLFKASGGCVRSPAAFRDFADTAAAIMNLDLVITVDTSVAHLAGALGKPVWLLLSSIADWRWLREREDSPWYPTMRLFRQKTPGAWADVIACVDNELKNLTRTLP